MKLTGMIANRQSQLQHYGNRLSNEVIKQKERCEKDGSVRIPEVLKPYMK